MSCLNSFPSLSVANFQEQVLQHSQPISPTQYSFRFQLEFQFLVLHVDLCASGIIDILLFCAHKNNTTRLADWVIWQGTADICLIFSATQNGRPDRLRIAPHFHPGALRLTPRSNLQGISPTRACRQPKRSEPEWVYLVPPNGYEN